MSYKRAAAKNRRQLETRKAKNQQRRRRKDGILKKVYEYSVYCDADAYIVLRTRNNGKIFAFSSTHGWSPSLRELVGPYLT